MLFRSAMDNLAKMKDRKMQSAFNRLYEIVFNVPKADVSSNSWTGIKYQFTRNVPRNILEEAQIVAQLSGQVSNETKLSVLSPDKQTTIRARKTLNQWNEESHTDWGAAEDLLRSLDAEDAAAAGGNDEETQSEEEAVASDEEENQYDDEDDEDDDNDEEEEEESE